MQQRLVYSPAYNTNLALFGVNKPFALDRGHMVLQKLDDDFGEKPAFLEPEPITNSDILLVHTKEYVETLKQQKTWIEVFELKKNEYKPDDQSRPLNELIDDILLKCGGTLQACEIALKHGLAANLGGGYHHAFPNEGRGFCVLNDIAIAVRNLQKRKLCSKVMIVDLDFHQGDGSAVVFQNDPNVYTLSVHSKEGWPEVKQKSTLDVEIATNETHLYLPKMKEAIHKALSEFTPDLCVYVAGSDPYELDVLPGTKFIKLTLEEMQTRDQFVIDTFVDKNIPLASVFSGGYGPYVWQVHYWATRHMLTRANMLPVLV